MSTARWAVNGHFGPFFQAHFVIGSEMLGRLTQLLLKGFRIDVLELFIDVIIDFVGRFCIRRDHWQCFQCALYPAGDKRVDSACHRKGRGGRACKGVAEFRGVRGGGGGGKWCQSDESGENSAVRFSNEL